MGKSRINRLQQAFVQHSFDDILGRTHHIKVFMPFLNFCQHDFVDIKRLIHDTDIFSRLLLIIFLKIFQYAFTYVVCPVVHLEHVFARFIGVVASCQQTAHTQSHPPVPPFHLLFHLFFALSALRLIIISSTSITTKITADSGRSSGVRPPLRASA